jgi:hypothetical protein
VRRSPMPDRKPRRDGETPRADKVCKTCGRAFPWRKQWERDWDIVRYCSDVCRGQKPGARDSELEAAILALLADRGRDKTICPSEAAKLVGGAGSLQDWQPLMEPARAAARRLVTQGRVLVTHKGRVVDPSTAKGPIRIKLA